MGWLALARRDVRTLLSLPPHDLLGALWRLLRPAFWIVTIFPVYLGYVYASGQLFPAQEVWIAYVRSGLAGGFRADLFLATLRTWLARPVAQDFVYALLVLGPFIWGGTLLYNDVQDLEADRAKDMRSESPLVQGYVSRTTALGIVYVLSAVGMGLSWLVGPTFFVLMAAALFLSWAYSAPPLHLKARPGWDIAVNVLGIGVLCFVGGYVLVEPVTAFPWHLLAPAVLTLAGVYVPTVIADYHVDRRFGVGTTAVQLGPRTAFWIGFGSTVASDLSLVALAATTGFVPWSFLAATWPLLLLKDALYYVFIGRVRDVVAVWIGIFLVGFLVGIVNLLFVLVHTGFLVL